MPTLSHLDRIGDEIAEVRAWQGRRQRVQQRAAQYDPSAATRLAEYARRYPNTPFGLLEPFVLENMPADDPTVRQVMDLNYRRNAFEGGGPATRGQYFTSRAIRNMANWQRSVQSQLPGAPYAPPVKMDEDFATASLPRKLLEYAKARAQVPTPLSYENVLRIKGLLDKDGQLHRPVSPNKEYRPGGAIVSYDSPADEQLDRQFNELMQTIASEQGNRDPIPFINDTDDGRLYLYYPRTGLTSAAENDVQFAEAIKFPAALQAVIDNGKQTLEDWLDRRPPDPFGAGRVQVAGFGPQDTWTDRIRTAGIAANAPIQEAVGQVRNIYAAQHGTMTDPSMFLQSQSDLGVMLDTNADPGDGFFVDPESDVARMRHDRELQRGNIGGHAITPGRWLADSVGLSVDSKPFDLVSGAIDFTVQVVDPSILAAKGISRASAARRLFEPEEVTGLFSGIRRQFHGPTWDAFSKTDEGQLIKETIARASGDASSPYDIWVGMGRRHNPELAVRLYEADTVEKVDDVFRDVIGSQVRSTTEIDRLPWKLNPEGLQALNPHRAGAFISDAVDPQMLPDYRLDATNKLDAASNMERWLKVGRAGDDVIKETFNRIALAPDKNGVEQAVEYAMEAEQGVLAQAGIKSVQKRRQLTNLFRQSRDRATNVFLDSIANDTPVRDWLVANGIEVQDLNPQLTMEYLDRFIPLPDITRIRRVTADPKYRWLLTSVNSREIGKRHWPIAALDFVQDEFWKPMMLVGRAPAWIIRVVAEEQLRLAASGLNGLFNHPLSAISIMIGRRAKAGLSGTGWDEILDHEAAMARSHGGSMRRAGSSDSVPIHIDKENPDQADDFLAAYADQVALLHFDPVSRTLLNSNVDETLEWLKGKGRNQLRKLRTAEPDKFVTDDQIRTYLTDTLGERVRILTHDNPDLLEAIKTGKLKDIPMFRKGGPKLNRAYINEMENYLDSAPRLVKGFEPFDQSRLQKYHAVVNWLFANTMSRATNFLSRSPVFKQLYWKNVADLMPYVSDDVRTQILASLDDAKLTMGLKRDIHKATRKTGTTQINSIEELETLASGYALDGTKARLYDLSNRGQLAESFSVLSPFVNAWQEIITTWPKLLAGERYGWAGKVANIFKASHRAQQTIEGGRRNGWFMKNQFGEEVFVFPFSEAYTNWATGIPVPITGRVQGLSMMFDVFPSVGPVAALPVSWMMDGKPGWKEVYDQILPYGAPGERDPNQVTNLLAFTPSWMQKWFLAMSAGAPPWIEDIPGVKAIWPTKDEVIWDHNAYMNTQKDIMKYLISTGDFDPSTREGMQELTQVAKEKAKDLYYIRAGLQFFAPTAPAYEFLVEDKDGRRIAQWVVTEEYYNYLDQGMTLDEASMTIIEKYGLDILSLTVPKTRASTYNVPRTVEAGEWLAENKDIKDKYPGVYGFFAPQGGELDYGVLVDQYATGDLQVLTPNQWLNLRNDMMQMLEYNYYRDQIGANPTEEQEKWLRQIKSELAEAYPASTKGIMDKPDYEELIPELYDAIEDPKLKNTDMGQALTEYFYYRDQAMQAAIDAGYAGFQRPNAMLPTRQWLSDIALGIIEDYPDFELVWSSTLSREFEKELR